ncbi:MAG: alpha-hydroxy-acid oxidizing protein [Actinobacteria bacterium]|nr:alpha-hydroxy-acid oxidizing protein [Actinomycetota bacterium]
MDLWGRRLSAPLLVSCMTGGVGEAGPVNRALATAAQRHGIAVGLGSGRVLLEDHRTLGTFAVRDAAPDVMLLANLGAVQLHGYTAADCARLVEACEADALVLHLNAVQEAVQSTMGDHDRQDTRFGGLLERIADVCAELTTPVVVKEVGFGMAPEDVTALAAAGVAGVDVAGAGGTNWARVEGSRDEAAGALAAAFGDWGWPTATCVAHARAALDAAGSRAVLVGSGGLRDGVDACKVLCLGADVAGMGRGLLRAGAAGPQAATAAVGVLVEQLRVATWAVGAAGAGDLTSRRLTGATTAAAPP